MVFNFDVWVIWRSGLSPGHGERRSASLYSGSGAEPPAGVQKTELPVRGQVGEAPPEDENSAAFEAPAEEPNLTLVTDSFLHFI